MDNPNAGGLGRGNVGLSLPRQRSSDSMPLRDARGILVEGLGQQIRGCAAHLRQEATVVCAQYAHAHLGCQEVEEELVPVLASIAGSLPVAVHPKNAVQRPKRRRGVEPDSSEVQVTLWIMYCLLSRPVCILVLS